MSDFVLTPPSLPHKQKSSAPKQSVAIKSWVEDPENPGKPLVAQKSVPKTIDHKVETFLEKHDELQEALSKKIQLPVVPQQQQFQLATGQSIESLHNLKEVLPSMDQQVFEHHVTSEKNDFSNWVRDVMHEDVLADKLTNAPTKQAMMQAIEERTNPEAVKKLATLRQQVLVLKTKYDEKNNDLQHELRKREAELYSLHKELDDIMQDLSGVEQDIKE